MRIYLIILFVAIACFSLFAEEKQLFPIPKIPIWPEAHSRRYDSDCLLIKEPLKIDGLLTEMAWQRTYWTEPFVDIVGNSMPKPRYLTKVKMLWDDQYLYIGAELEEPDLWATLKERDSVIFHDNDFEVFIDPDGDTHNYYELEINALNTVWDLFLTMPYRDGDKVALNGWDINGLKTAVHLNGTLNDPSDKDTGWTVEMALPWKALGEFAPRVPPLEGDTWRINFSRVEWKHDVVKGQYSKQKDAKGNALPEDNWVWSPQGLVAMHYPEMWGYVQFDTGAANTFSPDVSVPFYKSCLREIYYAEKEYYLHHNKYTSDVLKNISLDYYKQYISGIPIIEITSHSYIAYFKSDYYTWYINEEGKLWPEKNK